jgi:hypothetical protein
MPQMQPRLTRSDRPAQQGGAAAVSQCRSLPAADARQHELAGLARQTGSAHARGLPPRLQEGIERLSGLAMDHVQVHRDSPEPARMQALAFAQGAHIHLASGQEEHLPHEAWHVVQQAQGRVSATARQGHGAPVNDDPALEQEADAMGQAALAAGGGGPTPAQLRAAAPGGPAVVQRVGGTKIALRIDDAVAVDDPLLPELIKVFTDYKKEIQDTKRSAAADFKGKEKDIDQQTAFAKALRAAEMNFDVLKQRITESGSFRVNGEGVIRRKVQPKEKTGQSAILGKIVQGNAAFAKTASKTEAIIHDLYSKFDPASKTGLKTGSEYIQVNGRMLRRYAYRGITPLEIAQIEQGGAVKPLFNKESERSQAKSGMHFEGGFGKWRKQTSDKLDLGYLQGFSTVTSVTPAMYGFLHGRKGVGKFFSLRSTPGDITSNHGASFSDFGEVKIDLAQVPESDFVFHYADGGGDALQSGVPQSAIPEEHKEKHTQEVQRARESVVRNREIILKAYPAAAVSWVRPHNIQAKDIEAKGYDDGWNGRDKPDYVLYQLAYDRGYQNGQKDYRQDWQLGANHGASAKKNGNKFSPWWKMNNNAAYMAGYRFEYNKR